METHRIIRRQVTVGGSLRKVWAVPEVGILIPLVLFTALFFVINPAFLSPNNIGAMLRATSFVGIIAIGQTFLMIAGELDLSVGSVAGLCAIAGSWLMKNGGWPAGAGAMAGLLTGGLVGLINGLVVVRLGLPAFIGTLGMLYIARGLVYLITSGYPIYPLPASLKAFGAADILGTSWSFVIFVVLVIIADFVLRRTVFGRMVCATGGNKEVARIAGINTDLVKISCFSLIGMLSGLGGFLLMSRIAVGQPEIGVGWELDVIAGVVIGGVSLFGGIGTVAGTFIGLLVMQIVRSGLVISGVSTHWQTVAVGVIMIIAVGVDLLRRRAKTS